MPVLTDDDVGLGQPKLLSDADVGLGELTGAEKAADSLRQTRALVRESRLARMKEAAGAPSMALALPEALQEPVLSPETITRGIQAVTSRLPMYRTTLGPAAPGSVRQGLEQFGGEVGSSLTTPSIAAAIALTPVAPEVIGPIFGYQGYKDVPEAVAQAVTGETPAEKVKGIARVLLDAGMIGGAAKALRNPRIPNLPLSEAEIAGLPAAKVIPFPTEDTGVSETTLDRLAQEAKTPETKSGEVSSKVVEPTPPTSATEQPDFQRSPEESDLGAGAAKAVGAGPSQAEIAPPVEKEGGGINEGKEEKGQEEVAPTAAEPTIPSPAPEKLWDEMTAEEKAAFRQERAAKIEEATNQLNAKHAVIDDLLARKKISKTDAMSMKAGIKPVPEVEPTPAKRSITKDSQEFDALVKEHGFTHDWILNPDALFAEAAPGHQNTMSIKGKILQGQALKQARLRAAGDIGLKGGDVDTPAGRAKALDALKKFIEEEKVREMERNPPENANTNFLPDEPTAAPKLGAGEKGTGELFKGADQPFNLSGESEVDLARVQREKEAAAKQVEEAKAAQEKAQGQLPGTEPSPQALGIAPGQAAAKAIGEKLSSIRSKLANSWGTRGNKADIARLKDAADNQSRILAAQQGKSVLLEARRTFSGQARQALKAVIPVIESGGDRARLQQFIAQSRTHFEARKAAEFAEANWDRLQPLAAKIKAIHDAQIAQENAHGIATEYRENYIKHAFDVEKLPNRGQEFFGSGGAGARSGFKAARKFETVYDAIEAGYGKALKSLDADKLTQSRLASGQQLINDRQWVNGFRGITDPTTGKPLVDDVTFDRNHFPIAPPGYDAVQVLPGQFIAVHNGYGKIFKAVTGESKIAQGEIAGLPAGELLLNTAAGIKHGLLLFDTFHASRIMQKQFFLTGKVGWNKGLSLLDYTDADLNEAVRQGEITSDMANYARANRPTAQLLLREGLNVGRIQEALRNEVVRNLPVVGAFNRLVFDKITRGAMMESALIEFERVRANNPGMTAQAAAAMTAKKINITFGNIGRQGLFKSRTMQDLSRLLALAPQWIESMARSEVGGFKELGQVPVDLALGKGLQVGTLGKTMAGGLLAYVVGTQLLNLATRGQFTWQNKEEGHKLDAWIPDVTGKTPGFFLNPLSVVAELTHDAYRYAFKSDSAIDIAGEILNNKMSPLARSQKIFWTGRNYSGEKIDGTWKRIKESAAALTPAPIPVSGFNSGRPGQAQRQLTASAGIKTEPAPTATKQIADKAARFVADKGKPKEVDLVYHEGSPHNALRNAIARGDEEAAMQAIATLRKTQTDAKIYQAWRQTLTHPFTGSAAMEAKFRQSLSEDDKQLYDAAKKERQARFTAFHALWAKRK